jgi:hypothetical protein
MKWVSSELIYKISSLIQLFIGALGDCMIGRLRSLMFDKRLPHLLPYAYLRNAYEAGKVNRMLEKNDGKKVEKLSFAVTYDVEKDPIERGDKGLDEFLSMKSKKATFFVEGSLISGFKERIVGLAASNEIGSHGYDHENWGDDAWWLPKIGIDGKEKSRLVAEIIDIFKENNLKAPVSFRAPFTLINDETLRILKSFRFEVDSSIESYLGGYPFPKMKFGLMTIPISMSPIAKFAFRGGIPHAYYEMFTLKTVLSFSQEELLDYVGMVVSLQSAKGISPNLVFLSHPWEYMDMGGNDSGDLSYCSSDNYEVLKETLNAIESRYMVEYVTMKELKNDLDAEKNFGGEI